MLTPNPWDVGSARLLASLGFDTVRRAVASALAGCSIEDATGRPDAPVYDLAQATASVAAAAEPAHGGAVRIVITARAENHLHGRHDLADTIARLPQYQQAGADVLSAPGLIRRDDIRQPVTSVDRPVNVLARAGVPSVTELAPVGVGRISVGGGFAFAALGAVVGAARELLDEGTDGFREPARSPSGRRPGGLRRRRRPVPGTAGDRGQPVTGHGRAVHRIADRAGPK